MESWRTSREEDGEYKGPVAGWCWCLVKSSIGAHVAAAVEKKGQSTRPRGSSQLRPRHRDHPTS